MYVQIQLKPTYPYGYTEIVKFPEEVNADVIKRLRRLEGQIRGIQRMVEEGDECRNIVTQLAAAQGALDRVGFKLMAAALTSPDRSSDTDELEKLFLKLT
jgi:DNA-binding FrmR family transcriptional regulator